MIGLPHGIFVDVSLGYVEVVRGYVQNEHGLFVDLVNSEARILAFISSGGSKDRIESNRLRLVVSSN